MTWKRLQLVSFRSTSLMVVNHRDEGQPTITNWFIRKRGRALGVMSSSFQLSSTFLIPLAQFVILRWGWRLVYTLLGAATAVMVLIPAAVFLRKRPEDIGLLPDGAQPAAAPATDRSAGSSGATGAVHGIR